MHLRAGQSSIVSPSLDEVPGRELEGSKMISPLEAETRICIAALSYFQLPGQYKSGGSGEKQTKVIEVVPYSLMLGYSDFPVDSRREETAS